MTRMQEPAPESGRVSLEKIQRLTRIMMAVPHGWVACVAVAAVASLFQVSRAAGGGLAFEFHVTNTTVLLLAVGWLPALLAVVAVAGGGLKTPAGEATTGGLLPLLQALDTTAKQAILPALVAGLEEAETESQPSARDQVRTLRREAEQELAALPLDTQTARRELAGLAKAYDAIREAEPPGRARTMHMRELVASARAAAVNARLDEQEVRERCSRFGEAPDGERIVTLTLIEALHEPDCFPAVLTGIGNSRSAFEQSRALRVAQRLLPSLDAAQRAQLRQVIDKQRKPGGYILPGTDRIAVADQISDAMAGPAATS